MPVLFASDAKLNADALWADIAGGVYTLHDQPCASLEAIEGMTISNGGGIARSPGGGLYYFGPGEARRVPGIGQLREAVATNKIANQYNFAPSTTSGWFLSGSAAAGGSTLTVVDDMAALYAAQDPVSGEYLFRDLIDKGRMNGKVIRVYNANASTSLSIPAGGGTGPDGGIHSISAYVRCSAGSADIRMFGGAGVSDTVSSASYQLAKKTNMTAVGNQQFILTVHPLSVAYIIGANLTDGADISSPIATIGLPVTRAVDTIWFDSLADLSRPCTIELAMEIGKLDNVDRRLITLENGRGQEIVVLRHQDNSLSCTQTDEPYRPGVARCFGPGLVHVGLRVSPMGRAVGMAGVLQHDPFSVPPPGLCRLHLGAAADGSSPINGWIRSIRITHELNDDAAEASIAGAVDPLLFDFARYVSPTGDDALDGRTPATAWQTLARAGNEDVALAVPNRGVLYLERGGIWDEELKVQNYATARPYGSGGWPMFGAGQTYGVQANGKVGFRLKQLIVRGALQRGVNFFGRPGLQLEDVDVIECGSITDKFSIGIANRGTAGSPANDFYMKRVFVRDIYAGNGVDDAGDNIYIERIGGKIIIDNVISETPIGHDADCVQVSSSTATQLGADAAHVILRNSVFDMKTKPSPSGKGAIVIQAGSCLIECCWGDGINFVYAIDSPVSVGRYNHAQGARLNNYSWLFGIGGAIDTISADWHDNTGADGNRAIAFSFNGTVPVPGGSPRRPYRKDVFVRRFDLVDCAVGLFVDAPTSGRVFAIRMTDVILPTDVRAAASPAPAGSLYSDFKPVYFREVAA